MSLTFRLGQICTIASLYTVIYCQRNHEDKNVRSEYHSNWEKSFLYEGAVKKSIQRNWKFTLSKFKLFML